MFGVNSSSTIKSFRRFIRVAQNSRRVEDRVTGGLDELCVVVGGQLDRATATHFIRGLGGGRGRCLGSRHSCKEKVIDNCSR